MFDSTTTNKGKRKTKSSPSTKNTSSSSSSASASSSSSSSLNGSSYGVDFSSYDVTGAEEDPGRLTVANVPINPQRPFQCPECKKCYPNRQGLYQHRFKIHGFRAKRDRAPGERGPSEEVLAKANGVLANNVTTLLWQKFYQEMSERFGVSNNDIKPFLQRTFQNIQNNPESALTGPIARKDLKTLEKNLDALKKNDDIFHPILEQIIKQFI